MPDHTSTETEIINLRELYLEVLQDEDMDVIVKVNLWKWLVAGKHFSNALEYWMNAVKQLF